MSRMFVTSSALLSTLLLGGLAHADTPTDTPSNHRTMRAIDGGLELGLSINSARSLGDISGGMNADDLVGSASELELQIGTRLIPNLALGFYATGQALASGNANGDSVYTGSAGLEVDIHALPHQSIDPWVSVGGGVRAILVADGGPSLIVGVELARVQAGIDFRISEDLAIGPVIGASATLHGAQRPAMGEFAELSDKGIHWVLTAGFGARFNAFGSRR